MDHLISEAGRAPLDEQGFLRLQSIVIGDERFVKLGLRKEGFVGEHDHDTQLSDTATAIVWLSIEPVRQGGFVTSLKTLDES
jgi:hypothetical protein